MAVQTEARSYDRLLQYTLDNIAPGMRELAFDANPLASTFAGRLNTDMFGSRGLTGRGKTVKSGGASIEFRSNLGKNSTVKASAGPYSIIDTTPQNNSRFFRANWKFYDGAITVSKFELQANSSDEAIASIVSRETEIGIGTLVDTVGEHIYDAGGVAQNITDLDSIISAGDALQGVTGATEVRWNSRGVSVRGTAPAAVSFAGGGFAATGLANWRRLYNNASEGSMQPDAAYTTHAIMEFYEGSLEPLHRITNDMVANSGFTTLTFKSKPVFADPQCTSGVTFFLNFDQVKLCVLEGSDFQVGRFIEAENSNAHVAKIGAIIQLVGMNRFALNKVTGQTA